MENKIIIFGAGQIGHMVLRQYGEENVKYFIDNNDSLWGRTVQNLYIKKVDDAIVDSKKYKIIIASKSYKLMEKQLLQLNIYNYSIFKDVLSKYYSTNELIFNPYQNSLYRGLSEDRWIEKTEKNKIKEEINCQVELLYHKRKLFNHVEIETINRCNGVCDFCPVSKKNDIRKLTVMNRKLFEDIILQLAEINYSGRLALFSNNEPFLDTDIIDKYQYARQHLPNATLFMFTNGTLLTIEKFKDIIKCLDELVIDNYQKDLKLIKPCEEIKKYCDQHSELKRKVTIVLRDPHEILTTRGGDAPNRKNKISYMYDKCVLPFKQLVIRPDGKLSLCCNDPYGKNTLGDLTKESIVDAWNNDKFKMVRECLHEGRGKWEHCKFCDTFKID